MVATCKETVIDKDFSRFAEAVTRQLFGSNACISRLSELNLLPSHGKLRFVQDTVPTNQTNVLCKKKLRAGLPELDLEE